MYYPNQCYIELTQECNLRCLHCFANGEPQKSSELTFEDVKSIYEQINELGVIYVNISGGEPKKNKDFFEIVEYAAKQPFQTIILTNGTEWSFEDIKRFASADPNRNLTVQISIDGPYEVMKEHRQLSKKQYTSIFKTTELFKAYGFNVTCLCVVNSLTAPSVIETAKDALNNKGFSNVQIVPLFITGRAAKNTKKLEGFWNEWAKIVKMVTEIKKDRIWGKDSDCINIGFFTLYELIMPLEKYEMFDDIYDVWGLDVRNLETYRKQIRRNYYCEGGWSELTISSDKKLYPCVASIRTSLVCGELEGNNLVDLWKNSQTLKWFRNDLDKILLKEPCNSCQYKAFCGGGCRLVSLELHGDLGALDERCPYVIQYQINQGT